MRTILVAIMLLMSSCASMKAFGAKPAIQPIFPSSMIDIVDIDEVNLKPVQEKFDELVNAGEKVILFRINSFGGAIFAGYDFIQHVENSKKVNNVRVQCVVDVKAMSMGFAFLQSFCDDRWMTKRSVLLAHNALTTTNGNPEQLSEIVQRLRAISDALSEVCGSRLKISVAAYKAKIAHSDWTMSWQEAIKVGAVDGVVEWTNLPPVYELKTPSNFQILFNAFHSPLKECTGSF